MGMSNVSSHLIMFIAVLSISTMVVGVFNDQMDSTTSAIVVQQNWLSQQMKTDISIEVIDFNNSTENQTIVYVENTGATQLETDQLDIYIAGERLDRLDSVRAIEVISDTDLVNTGVWDPDEEISITINKTLVENQTFTLVVTAQFGARDSDDFST